MSSTLKNNSITEKSFSIEGFSSDEELGNTKMAEAEVKVKKTKFMIILIATAAALGGLIFGYDIAGAGATFLMPGFKEHFGWNNATTAEIDQDKAYINGLFGAGATLGAVMIPWVADKHGRKPTLFVSTLVFIFGAALQTASPTMTVMFVGRVFSGYGIGALSMVSPVYIAELAPEHARGQLATLWQLAITAGILIAAAANLGLAQWDEGWRLSYGGNILFAIILLIALFFMPESPRFLVAKGLEDEAEEAMKRVRYEDEIEDEMKELKAEAEEEKEEGVATWSELLSVDNKMRYRLFLGIAIFTIQQLSGINAIMFYAPTILQKFFGDYESIVGTFVLNIINCLSTFITIYTVEKYGRVKLLVSGGLVMCMSLVACSILSAVEQSAAIGYVVVLFAAFYIVGFAYSWGPLAWVACAEQFPLRARGKATGVTSMTHWLWTTIVGAIFPMASTASLSGCFGFFSVVTFTGVLMIYFFMAETKQKTILEIDAAYANHKPRLLREDFFDIQNKNNNNSNDSAKPSIQVTDQFEEIHV